MKLIRFAAVSIALPHKSLIINPYQRVNRREYALQTVHGFLGLAELRVQPTFFKALRYHTKMLKLAGQGSA